MTVPLSFVAYPANPLEVAGPLRRAISLLNTALGEDHVHGWEENDISGRFLIDPIFEEIHKRDALVADVTFVNFNVTYELGYAIGQKKPVIPILNNSLKGDSRRAQEIGIFGDLGIIEYANSEALADRLKGWAGAPALKVESAINRAAPLYYLGSDNKSDALVHLLARIKATKYRFRDFDPYEQPSLLASEAIEGVATAAAVIVPILPVTARRWEIHNIRAAFVAGLAHGMQKACLILQPLGGPIPLDVREVVKTYRELQQIDEHVASLLPMVVEALQVAEPAPAPSDSVLDRLDFGQPMAENETVGLRKYYLQTDAFRSAASGNVRLVVGRKGSGKTAVFVQARDRWRQDKDNVVVALQPESYRLRKLRDVVLDFLAEGSREQLVTVFWEYLLLLETCSTILADDYELHLRNHHLLDTYQRLAEVYKEGEYASVPDFSERMIQLIDRLTERYTQRFGTDSGRRLATQEILSLAHEHDIPKLFGVLGEYLQDKNAVYVLFDNLDKGWASQGLRPEDVFIVRCLVAAADRLEHNFGRINVEAHVSIFLRNDVYEFLVDATPDRGKHTSVALDWDDRDLLRLLIEKRLRANKLGGTNGFDQLWNMVCVPHVHGEPSFDYMLDRCLMRPRYLLWLIRACRTVAVNRQHSRIREEDVGKGFEQYSDQLVRETDLEIRDIMPEAAEVMWGLLKNPRVMSRATLISWFPKTCRDEPTLSQRLFDLLLWFGVIGLDRGDDAPAMFIYDTGYSLKKLTALADKTPNAVYRINPAFEPGLEMVPRSVT